MHGIKMVIIFIWQSRNLLKDIYLFFSDLDKKMLSWLQEFQKSDLYSKLPNMPNINELLPYYQKIIKKYFPFPLYW